MTKNLRRKGIRRLLGGQNKMNASTSTKCEVFSGKLFIFTILSNARDFKAPMFQVNRNQIRLEFSN